MSGLQAELEFEFAGGCGTTAYRNLRQDPPWKVVRGFQQKTGECLVHLNNVSGGVFGGDSLRLRATLHAGAQAQVTTTGATRLYRPRAGVRQAVLQSEFYVGHDALLEYLPDALIPFSQARAMQRTSFSLEQGATLFAWDTVAAGRAASGERFLYEKLQLVTEVTVAGVPVLNDRLLLAPARWAMNSPARYGAKAASLVTLLAVQAGASKLTLRALEMNLNDLLAEHSRWEDGDVWGATTLAAHGVMVRGMVRSSLGVPAVLHSVWGHCKQELLGRQATPPRKMY